MGKIIFSDASVLELHISRSKGMTLGSDQFFSSTSRCHQAVPDTFPCLWHADHPLYPPIVKQAKNVLSLLEKSGCTGSREGNMKERKKCVGRFVFSFLFMQ